MRVTKPEAVYLALIDVDLDDHNSILNFVNTFGHLDLNTLLNFDGWMRDAATPELRDALDSEVVRRAVLESNAQADCYRRPRGGRLEGEPLAEFELGARCVRDFASAVMILGGAESTSEIEWEVLAEPPRDVEEARRVLNEALAPAVAFFHPLFDDDPAEYWIAGFNVPLFCVCCLELWNHVARRASHRRCPRCGDIFEPTTRRQRYCGPACQSAETSQRHRKKKAREVQDERTRTQTR